MGLDKKKPKDYFNKSIENSSSKQSTQSAGASPYNITPVKNTLR